MQSEQVQKVQTPLPIPHGAIEFVVGARDDKPRETMAQHLLLLMRSCQRVLFTGSGHVVAPHDADGQACAEVSTRTIARECSITQINDSDHAFLNAFSPQRKAQVMETIMSLTPTQAVVRQGYNQFEKAMMTIHREGYGLIDIQPQENAFTTVWYRKNASFLGKGADITMLLWEEAENGDAVTLMNWKI